MLNLVPRQTHHPSRVLLQPLILWVCLITPLTASAQASTGELRDEHYRHRIAGEMGFFYRDGEPSVFGFQPSLHGSFELMEQTSELPVSIQLEVDWQAGGAWGKSAFGEETEFRAMNPSVGARIGHEEGERGSRWRARGGVGITLPITNLYDPSPGILTGFVVALALPGAWDPWLAYPFNMALAARGDFEYRHTYFLVGAETAVGFLFPVEYQGSTGNTAITPEIGVWAAGRPVEQLALGARVQAVAIVATNAPRGASDAEGYTALVPFVRLELGSAFVETRLVMNLDEPLGFAFDDGRYWGAYLGAGGQL